MPDRDESARLAGLIGDECDQVWFVRDYVMVILEHSTITCVTDPVIAVGGEQLRIPEPGSRDALCDLINTKVTGASQRSDGTVDIEFDGGQVLSVMPWDAFPEREYINIAVRTW